MASGCDPFDITVSGELAGVLDQVRSNIVGAGGAFSGDASSGEFSGPTAVGIVKGSYTVRGGVVTVTITDKPFLVPCSTIESKVRDYFKL